MNSGTTQIKCKGSDWTRARGLSRKRSSARGGSGPVSGFTPPARPGAQGAQQGRGGPFAPTCPPAREGAGGRPSPGRGPTRAHVFGRRNSEPCELAALPSRRRELRPGPSLSSALGGCQPPSSLQEVKFGGHGGATPTAGPAEPPGVGVRGLTATHRQIPLPAPRSPVPGTVPGPPNNPALT